MYFGNRVFKLSYQSKAIGSRILSDGLDIVSLNQLNKCASFNVGTKTDITTSYGLWHKHLGYISHEKLKDLKRKELFLHGRMT